MATAAQIEANRRNARKSTGPRTAEGKARSRLNALKHGMKSRTVEPVLPHEDPAELDRRIREWIDDLQPRGPVERELVSRAARLSWVLQRAERHETARLAQRVRLVRVLQETQRLAKVHGLTRKLLQFGASPPPQGGEAPTVGEARQVRHPAVLVRRLEAFPEGCRWLLDRWTELRNLLDRGLPWSHHDRFTFVRLLGKEGIEAVSDPALSEIVLAWDVLDPGAGREFWEVCQKLTPRDHPGLCGRMAWREVVDRPAGQPEARNVVEAVIHRAIDHLENLLAGHHERGETAAPLLADTAAFDASVAGERLHRFQTARGREFLRTLETLLQLRQKREAAGMGKLAEGEEPATSKTTNAPVEPNETIPPDQTLEPDEATFLSHQLSTGERMEARASNTSPCSAVDTTPRFAVPQFPQRLKKGTRKAPRLRAQARSYQGDGKACGGWEVGDRTQRCRGRRHEVDLPWDGGMGGERPGAGNGPGRGEGPRPGQDRGRARG
jgi:hypothetical protein